MSSGPHILSFLQTFVRLSGYKLYLFKSEYLSINPSTGPLNPSVPFREMHNRFKYLGIMVTCSLNALLKSNFGLLMDCCKEDFARWSVLPLFLACRINLIKMIVLLRFLYLFQNLPIFIKKSFFNNQDKLIVSFLWGNKGHRIRKCFLGGMALLIFFTITGHVIYKR